ncbi:hypothetical protein [Burkholderia anthina]|uniref:hypothetical protein n=1 Tax=Burkholderia anthina TaxID=179879 RepID=UPI00292E54AA|nr:hypothetical protein [Burkholderia anthina]WJN72110.1 hypothetical protein OH687_38930 [Burkholderia anthina]
MRAPVPLESRSAGPAHLRDCVRRYRGTLPANVVQALLDAAHEFEASEHAFAVVVDQTHAQQQRRLAQTGSNLRAVLAPRARRPVTETTRTLMQEATTGDGRPAPTAYAALLLATERGYTHELFLRATGFFVTLRHADTMPDARIDAFLVVRDGGYPFLLAFVREDRGIRLRFNCYIASRLEGELRDTHRVEVIECAASAHRRYTVPLQHAFD